MEPLRRERRGPEVGRPSERELASETPDSIRIPDLFHFPAFLIEKFWLPEFLVPN